MKKPLNRCIVIGLAVACGVMLGCAKRETSSMKSMKKQAEATQPVTVDAVVVPANSDAAVAPDQAVSPPKDLETAIPMDHPGH